MNKITATHKMSEECRTELLANPIIPEQHQTPANLSVNIFAFWQMKIG